MERIKSSLYKSLATDSLRRTQFVRLASAGAERLGILQGVQMVALFAADGCGEAGAEGAQEQGHEQPIERVGDGFAGDVGGLLLALKSVGDPLGYFGLAETGVKTEGIALVHGRTLCLGDARADVAKLPRERRSSPKWERCFK
ncbi:MAG TPA: hypothetical protein VOA78_09385 [Candidatus Dormibacteraeota bacterium]|nr:hypothetical protein [Candidatus Dormibacteraeota bacterium]